MAKLTDLKGIGEDRARKMVAAGVGSVEQLLELGGSVAGRKDIAAKLGDMTPKALLELVNRADLTRIKGVSTQYSNLLEVAGVDTVKELAQRNAANLHKALADANERVGLVKQLPSANAVADWIAQARELPRRISY